MRFRCVSYAAMTAAIMTLPDIALAGAWTLDPGRGQLIFQGAGSMASKRFSHNGRSLKSDRFSKSSLTQTLEYGIRDGTTGVLGLDLQGMQTAYPDGPQSRGTGQIHLGLRHRLYQNNGLVISAQIKGIAGYERSMPKQNAVDPRLAAESRLLVGYGFTLGGMQGFADVQAGYRWHGGPSQDEFRLDATLGIRPHIRWLLLLQSFNSISVARDRRYGTGRIQHNKLQISAVYDLTQRWSLQIGGFTTLRGRETMKETGVLTAAWFKF
jgi:protein XagA